MHRIIPEYRTHSYRSHPGIPPYFGEGTVIPQTSQESHQQISEFPKNIGLQNDRSSIGQQFKETEREMGIQRLEHELQTVLEAFETTYQQQGWMGKSWDLLKNTLGVSPADKTWLNPVRWWAFVFNADNGSKATSQALHKAQQQLREMRQALHCGNLKQLDAMFQQLSENSGNPLNQVPPADWQQKEPLLNEKLRERSARYRESQGGGVDCIADLVSGFVSFGGYSLVAASLAGNPLAYVMAGALGTAVVIGALTKTSLKYSEAKSGRQAYQSGLYDIASGGFSGLLAPLTSAAGSAVAGKLGPGQRG